MTRLVMNVAAMVAGIVTAAGAAHAGQISATSYDMPNGDGQASGGEFNYWDANYTGSGATTTDGAALSGGLGKLTDGVVSTSPWYLVSNDAGTGEYVGWLIGPTPDPTVSFHFAGSPTITDIQIQMDNTQVGGVFAPAAILFDGVAAPFTAPAPGSVGVVDFSGLHLTGGVLTVQFDQQPGSWTFISEVSFFGSNVPEPGAWMLLIGGLALTGAALRHRRSAALAA